MAIETLILNTNTYGGETLGRLNDGRAVFVPHTIPHEKVRIETIIEKPRYAKAKLLEILEASPERIPPRCPHYAVCGGCHYQHLNYDTQLQIKADILCDQLKRIGKIEAPTIDFAISSSQPWHYQNQVRFHVTRDGRLGFQGVHDQGIVAIDKCHVLNPAIDRLWPQIDIDTIPGLKHISIRTGAEKEIMVVFESSDPEPFSMNLDLSISVIHRGPNGFIVLAGDDHIIAQIRDRNFRVSAESSLRTNPLMAAHMVDHILNSLPDTPNSTLLSAYAGIGLISAFLAPRVGHLVAIENSPSSCDDFTINLDEYNNVELFEAPIEHVLQSAIPEPDIIVVEPPSSGLSRHAMDGVLSLAPEMLVYISRNPSTLARDANRLTQGNFHLHRITPVDLFPQTYHIGSISFWKKS